MRAISVSILFIVLQVFASTANADNTYPSIVSDGSTGWNYAWSMVASGCVIDSSTAGNAVIDASYGSVSFGTGKTGNIYMTCPVPVLNLPSDTCGQTIYLTAIDGGTTNQVSAWLNDISMTSGAKTNIASVYATTNSVTQYSATFATAMNFNSNYYWIGIAISRSVTTTNPVFYGVALNFHGQPCN